MLYLHGVPTSSDDWAGLPRSARAGWRPTCPGFGRSGKRGDGDFTMPGYDRFVEDFLDHAEVERVRLVVHDWGVGGPAVGAAPPRARRAPGRDQRRPAAARLSLAPRRPAVAHAGRRRGRHRALHAVGLAAAAPARRWPRSPGRTSTRAPSARSCSSTARARRTRWPAPAWTSGASTARRSSCGAIATPTSPPRFADAYADALGGDAEVLHLHDAGHWPWLDRPDAVDRIAAFLDA